MGANLSDTNAAMLLGVYNSVKIITSGYQIMGNDFECLQTDARWPQTDCRGT